MNKELRKEIIELEYEAKKRINEIETVREFLRDSGKYYKKKESIEALEQIKGIIEKRNKEYKILKEKAKKMRRRFQEVCPHEVTIEEDLNCFCIFCRKLMFQERKNTILNIKLPINLGFVGSEAFIRSNGQHNGKRIQDRIYEIVDEGLEQEDTISYIEDSLEDLQYTTDIKARRIKP